MGSISFLDSDMGNETNPTTMSTIWDYGGRIGERDRERYNIFQQKYEVYEQ